MTNLPRRPQNHLLLPREDFNELGGTEAGAQSWGRNGCAQIGTLAVVEVLGNGEEIPIWKDLR